MRAIIYLILVLLVLPSVIAITDKQQGVLDRLNELSEGDSDRASEIRDVASVRNISLEDDFEDNYWDYTIIFILVAGVLVILIIFFIYKRMKIHEHKEVKIKEAKEISDDEEHIINYIKGARHAGLNDKEIKINLLSVDWNNDKIEDAFKKL